MRFSRRILAFAASGAAILPLSMRAQGTPQSTAVFDDASERINELLQYVPDGTLVEDSTVTWNDFERNADVVLENAGAAAESLPADQLAMMSLFAIGPEFISRAMQLPEGAGFAMGEILQSLEFGVPLDMGLLVKLNRPAESLVPFWESMDYQERENEYGTFWTIGEEGVIDIKNPINRLFLARMNNVAILSDNTLAYANKSSLLGEIQATAAGDAPNRISTLEPVAAGFPNNATNAWFVGSELFMYEALIGASLFSVEAAQAIESDFQESNDTIGSMPVLRSACVGVTAGGHRNEDLHDPTAREFLILETMASGEAEQAAAVIEWRTANQNSLLTGEPYGDLLSGIEIDVLVDDLLRCSVPLEIGASKFATMIMSRDILPFAFRFGE